MYIPYLIWSSALKRKNCVPMWVFLSLLILLKFPSQATWGPVLRSSKVMEAIEMLLFCQTRVCSCDKHLCSLLLCLMCYLGSQASLLKVIMEWLCRILSFGSLYQSSKLQARFLQALFDGLFKRFLEWLVYFEPDKPAQGMFMASCIFVPMAVAETRL
jgi:hypothetical protein